MYSQHDEERFILKAVAGINEGRFLDIGAWNAKTFSNTRALYERGWSGGVMKTAFDNVPIHIPGEYMFCFNSLTYGNADNVSGHPLDRV